jgi:hypothetical protein
MVAMAIGRFSCEYLRPVCGRKVMVAVGGLLALVGMLVTFGCSVFLTRDAAIGVASVGLTITGFGLSTLLPIVFSSAGHLMELTHCGNMRVLWK